MRKKILWNEDLFFKLISFANSEELINRIKESEGDNFTNIEINKPYSLYKNLFGVKIESGQIRFIKIIIKEALEILNLLTELFEDKKKYYIETINNIDNVIKFLVMFDLEKPNIEIVKNITKDYVMNRELVRIINNNYTTIYIKYKDSPNNIFYLYKNFFTVINEELYLVIEKGL